MPYDERLFERMLDALERKEGWSEKNMYGGRVCVVNGHAFVGAVDGGLIALCPEEALRKHLELKHCTPFKQDGKEHAGWVKVSMDALKTAKQLSRWVDASFTHASALPAAKAKPKARKK
ncbi:MAG: TfoX/Sxy family protein [Planctomycetes bacterium]|nr:TfoX/Sxy family protein [Planctomycetota bacterium]